jgi:hypothetical protein
MNAALRLQRKRHPVPPVVTILALLHQRHRRKQLGYLSLPP